MLELRHLRYFIAVAEELNFSRAAERLHMAQPPLSVAIRQLEQELGATLLERTTRDVRLTEAGRAFLDGAHATLAELDRSIVEARRASCGEVGRLRVAFSWGARFVTLPALGQAFRTSYPDVELLTEEMWNSRMSAALRSGLVDLAVSVCPEVNSELSYETIRTETVLVLLSADHPLAGEEAIELERLSMDAFVLFPREFAPRLYDSLVGICRRAGFEPTVRSESFHTSWELRVLDDVPAVALVPESVTLELPERLVGVPIRDCDERIETAIVWHKDDASAVGSAFREVARTVFAEDYLKR
jgi:DNA-binding transcriptional LysR family regulator